jgi:signal transduction histidine kinase
MARSLRTRLVVGAVLWTFGLFGILVLLHNELMLRNPWLPRRLTRITVMHTPLIAVIAAICLVIGIVQVRRGVSGVQRLRGAVTGLRKGEQRRIEGSYPSEVQPLVDDLNALLDHREQAVGRALGRAGDLAHGLKTPLALLAREAERARDAGHHDLASTLSDEVDRMRRQVRHRERTASSRTQRRRSAGRSTGCTRIASSRWRSLCPPIWGSAANARTSTRSSGTCSTTPATGRLRVSC